MTEIQEDTPETPDEATESPETPSDGEEQEDTPEEPASPEEPSEAPEGSMSKEQMDEIHVKLGRRAENYFKSVKEIGVAELGTFTVCELCADSYPGLRDLRLDPTVIDRVRQALFGLPSIEDLEEDQFTRECRRCRGVGVVRTGSRVYGQEARTCRACNGAGYEAIDEQTGALIPVAQSNGHEENEPLPGVNPSDPEIANLIAQGYTIVPPMRPIAVAETS